MFFRVVCVSNVVPVLRYQIVQVDALNSGSFGRALSIGERNLAVAALLDQEGVVYMYRYEISDYEVNATLVQRLVGPNENFDLSNFGASVSLFDVFEIGAPEASVSATVAVGAPPEADSVGGVVFVYYAANASNPQWDLQDTILPPIAAITRFGQTVSLYTNALVCVAWCCVAAVLLCFR